MSELKSSAWFIRIEFGLLLLIAFAVRAVHLDRVAVEHFDEGVYASAIFSEHLEYRYPDEHLYAPPLFPALLEWSLIFGGLDPAIVMWVNVILGTALVAAVWWLGQLTGGISTARAAGIIVAFSDYFIEYSRAALTDIPVCLLMTLAVIAYIKAIKDENSLWLLAVAGLTSASWWTKYNGWLPLAITGSATVAWCVMNHFESKQFQRLSLQWITVAIGSVLLFMPCYFGLEQYGGYASVAKNHSGYVVGFSGWWTSLMTHLAVQHYYTQSLTLLGLLGVMGVLLENSHRKRVCLLGILITAGFMYSGGILTVVTLTAISGFAISGLSEKRHGIEYWLILAWFTGLTIATPLYKPFPRLLMPWFISAALGTGLLVTQSIKAEKTQTHSKVFLVFLVMGLGVQLGWPGETFRAGRHGLKQTAKLVLRDVKKSSREQASRVEMDAIIYVLAEPGLYYHLAAQEYGRFNFITQPAASLSLLFSGSIDQGVPTFLVTHKITADERTLLQRQATFIASHDSRASDLALLDDLLPDQLHERRTKTFSLWLLNKR